MRRVRTAIEQGKFEQFRRGFVAGYRKHDSAEAAISADAKG
jgi:queuine/archaeosine tRNA-ribosyltransferase